MKYRQPQIRIDKERFQVFIDGKEVVLPTMQFDIFLLLCEADGRVITKNQIIRKIWRCPNVARTLRTKAVEKHISRLRRVLPKVPPLIRTVPSRGYSLIRY